MKKTDKMLIRMISQSKGQYIAVLSIIIIGVVIFTALGMSALNMDKSLKNYYDEYHFSNLFAEGSNFPNGESLSFNSFPEIKSFEGKLVYDVPFIGQDESQRINIRLNSTKGLGDEQNQLYLIEGSHIKNPGKEIILGKQFALAREINIGDIVKFQANGRIYNMEVCGIADSPEYIYIIENSQSMLPDNKTFGIAFIDETFMQQIFSMKGSYNRFSFEYTNALSSTEEQDLINRIEKVLKPYGLIRLTERKYQLSNNMIETEVNSLNKMSSSLPILFLAIAAIILAMMLSRMVKKDRIKIGVLKALGYEEKTILMHYVKYALSAGIIGGVLAAIIGTLTAGYMTEFYLTYFNIPMISSEIKPGYSILSVILSGSFCGLFGILGAKGILKITTAEAMRSELPKNGKRIFLEKIPFIWKRLSFSRKMIMKNVFRNKKRTGFVIFGVLITYGMILFVMTMPDVIDQMLVKHFSDFQKMEYNLTLKKPINKNAISDLKHVIDVKNMEGKLEYPFEMRNANKKQVVNIIGITENTEFYSFADNKKNAVKLPREGMLISDNLAKILDVKVGQKIQIKSFLDDKEDVYIQVKGIISQSMGINAYMNIEEMGRTLVEKDVINGIYFNSDDPDVTKELMKATNVESILSMNDIKAIYEEYMGLMIVMIGFMLIFSGILGFAITFNATVISLSEREMEFSTLRVLGFTKKEIFNLLLMENAFIIIVGLILGLPAGVAMLKYSNEVFSTEVYSLTMNPTLTSIVSAALITVAFMVLAQLATYRKINKLDFMQSLKNRE